MIEYGFTKELALPFVQGAEKVIAALEKEGFGILSCIDVKEKFKEKLGLDFKEYVILGACSPANAHKAILAEENIGLMLPCNVLVYEKEAVTVVSMIRPTRAMGLVGNDKLTPIAEEVEARLKKAFDSL